MRLGRKFDGLYTAGELLSDLQNIVNNYFFVYCELNSAQLGPAQSWARATAEIEAYVIFRHVFFLAEDYRRPSRFYPLDQPIREWVLSFT